jgi:hypothetical protein
MVADATWPMPVIIVLDKIPAATAPKIITEVGEMRLLTASQHVTVEIGRTPHDVPPAGESSFPPMPRPAQLHELLDVLDNSTAVATFVSITRRACRRAPMSHGPAPEEREGISAPSRMVG